MPARWKELNIIGKYSDTRVEGFDNSQNLGVCLTNVLLAMITSSVNLMNTIKCKEDNCPKDIKYQIEQIQLFVCHAKPSISVSARPSDVLIRGICDTVENKVDHSTFGVAGDYYLLKSFLLKKAIPYSYKSTEVICNELIRSSKVSDSLDYFRWKDLMKDLFNSPHTIHKTSYPFSFDWYPELRMLNVHSFPTTLIPNPTELRPFLPTYQDNFKFFELKKFDRTLTKLKVNPRLISMNFETKDMVRLHNRFYMDFLDYLNETYHSNERFNLTNFSIYYYPQSMSFPHLRKEGNKYPFKINGTNKFYELKAVAVIMVLEKEIKLGSMRNPSTTNSKPSVTYRSCLNNMIIQTRIFLQHKHFRSLLKWFNQHFSVISTEFIKICEYLLTDGKDQFNAASIHALALVYRDNKWIMMNDHFSTSITDINIFNTMLKEESISGILLEDSTTI